MKKRGQMEMSFGMIFTIILIIVFIVSAFYGIRAFLDFQKEVQIKQFYENLQIEVDKMYKSTYGSKIINLNLPSNVKQICFEKSDSTAQDNLRLYLKKGTNSNYINHLDMEKILQDKSYLCAPPKEEKIKLSLQKEYGDVLVNIKFENE